MTQRVDLSTFSIIISVFCSVLLVGSIFTIPEFWLQICWTGFILIFFISSLWFWPLSITATDDAIIIGRGLHNAKYLPISEITLVKRYYPSRRVIRVCGSGGFLGYWGWFNEHGGIGRFNAYYGKSTDCFLVTMSNGKKYVLGCRNVDEMVEYINKILTKRNK